MKKIRLILILLAINLVHLNYVFATESNLLPSGCAVAGTANAEQDSICDNGNTDLILSGYVGNIQWQSFNGTSWVNETGPGSTTDIYTVFPLQTTDYRAYVTMPSCPDDSSNIITITVGVISAPTGTGASRCGYGLVTLQASGTGTLRWYDAPSNGNLVDTGTTISPVVFNTTTYYVESTSGGGNAAPLTTTYAGGNGFDGNMFDIEAISQVTITSFDGNFTNTPGTAEIWYRVGSYVGFTGSNAGWTQVGTATLNSTNGNGVATPIPIPVNITIPAGQKYAFYIHYSGSVDYTNGTGNSLTVTAQDANIKVFEGHGGAYFNLTNTPRIFNGTIHYSAGCASARTPVVATVIPSDPVLINAGANALCLGDSTTMTATSVNTNYVYSWSPSAGLNTTTGSTVSANPVTTVTYVVTGDDGTCADVDSITILVGPTSVAGNAFTISDTVCSGATTLLTLTGYTGIIQWQSNDGTGWVNETGPSNDSSVYSINPTLSKLYRAFVVSGGCTPDSSNILDIAVISVNTPTVTDSSRCGPGVVNLSASGNGTLNWYDVPVGGIPVNVGPAFGPSLTATTTYYVENSAGSGIQHVGPADSGIGNQAYAVPSDYGIQFDVSQTVTIERVYVYPGTAGTVTVNLRQTQGGPILNTASLPVTFNALTAIPLNFVVNPGTSYRLELANTSPQCTRNTTGAVWPYASVGVPVTLTANLTPGANTSGSYYFFYNWEVSTGCKSIRVPVTATIDSLPPVPVISVNGNVLSSSSASGNQWYLNGNPLTGETGQTLIASLPGSYTVTVTYLNCSSTSLPVVFSGLDDTEMQEQPWNIYPNPANGMVYLRLNIPSSNKITARIFDAPGKLLLERGLDGSPHNTLFTLDAGLFLPGVYLFELNVDRKSSFKKLVISH